MGNCCRSNPDSRSLIDPSHESDHWQPDVMVRPANMNVPREPVGAEDLQQHALWIRPLIVQCSSLSAQVFANYVDRSPTFIDGRHAVSLLRCESRSISRPHSLGPHRSRSVRPLKLVEVSVDDVWKPSGIPYSSASFFTTNEATTIEWKGHGLKIRIPDNSRPTSLSQFTPTLLKVHTHTFANEVQQYHDPMGIILLYPDEYMPASTLYSIQIEAGKLCKPVTIEFQHCLGSFIDISDLVILRAPDVSKHFEPIEDAVFDRETGYGKITVPKLDGINQEYDDFSWFIVALRRLFFPSTIRYKAHVYTSKITMKMYFIITMALELCTTVVERQYPGMSYDLQTSFSVEFDTRGKVSLAIPKEGIKLESGWVITPFYYPSITKQQVDRFCIFHNDIPKCEFFLQWSKVSSPTRLMHKIDLTEGTANSKPYFIINFTPQQVLALPPAKSPTIISAADDLPTDQIQTQTTGNGKHTAEYQTIRRCTPQLITAFKHNLTELSGHLLSKGLITSDQSCELRNKMYPESDRAAKLVDLILSRIELAPECYNVFIKALKEDKCINEIILKLLKET